MTNSQQPTANSQQLTPNSQLEQANPIIQVATELGIKMQGNMGTCFKPERHIHNSEMTLFFNPAKNSFFCKTCEDIGGTVIDLVCQYQGWDREEAVSWLSHRIDFDQTTRKLYYGRGKKKG